MSAPISVDMRSSANAATTTSPSPSAGQSIDGRISALKLKLRDLFDDLKQTAQERSPEAVEKAKMIQMQIQVTQAQIMQLEAMQQQKRQNGEREKRESDAVNQQTDIVNQQHSVGRNVDAFI